jgi:hypothetical protein
VLVLGLLLQARHQLARMELEQANARSDLRYACDLISGFEAQRDLGVKSAPADCAYYLAALQTSGKSPFTEPLAQLVETERKRAIRDIISHVRSVTGADYGQDLQKWIGFLESTNSIPHGEKK